MHDRLVEFTFTSRLVDLGSGALVLLARQSWSANLRAGITGAMRLDADRIDQTIEGPRDVVLGLAARILSDPRHREITIRAFGATSGRRFAEWRVDGFDHLDPCAPPAAALLRPHPALASRPARHAPPAYPAVVTATARAT